MNIIKEISCYFDRVAREIKLFKRKQTIIFSVVFFTLGVFSWMIGGKTNRVVLLYSFPKCAVGISFAFILWGLSFALCGLIFGGILYGSERYRHRITYKICLYISLMEIFIYITYPLFFKACAPFLACLAYLISIFFCFLAISSAFKYYSLWTILLSLHILWLIYNAYVCLAFIFIT